MFPNCWEKITYSLELCTQQILFQGGLKLSIYKYTKIEGLTTKRSSLKEHLKDICHKKGKLCQKDDLRCKKGMVSNRKIYAYEQTCKNVCVYIYIYIYIWANNIWGKSNTEVRFIELRKNNKNKILDSNHIQVRRGEIRVKIS